MVACARLWILQSRAMQRAQEFQIILGNLCMYILEEVGGTEWHSLTWYVCQLHVSSKVRESVSSRITWYTLLEKKGGSVDLPLDFKNKEDCCQEWEKAQPMTFKFKSMSWFKPGKGSGSKTAG